MRRIATLAVALLTACVPQPPEPAPAREATRVAVGFDQTWDAVIDHFAERTIPIATIDKASGLIATDRLRVSLSDGRRWADCGTDGWDTPMSAETVIYNVLVRGDESSSTVKVTASWSNPDGQWECTSRGIYEAEAEASIKERAEGS